MKTHEIREARAAKVSEARALLASSPTLTPEGQAKFDALKTEITALENQEARAQFVDDAERRSLGQTVDKSRDSMERQVNVLDAIRCQVEQRAAVGALAEFQAEAKRQGLEARQGGVLVPSSVFEKRATQNTTTNAAVAPDEYRPEQFIGLLRNSMIVRSLGARVLSGLRGDTVVPKQTGSASAFWIAEGAALTESSATYGNVTLSPKHVGALSSMSRQLIQQANPAIEQLTRDDFAQVIGLAVDRALIHGASAAFQPVGILATAGVQTAVLGTPTWAALVAMLEKLAIANVTPNAVLTHAKGATKLQTVLKNAANGAEYLMAGGRVADLPAYVTNQLDAVSGVLGRVIAGDFSQILIGEWGVTEILANPYATGFYERGDVQIRILHTMDAVVRQPAAFVISSDMAI
ncbi:phage major capsid protein [Rhodoferax antarcticus]|uniref:Phage capsid family protein n=1 Tax=Rhodoferax antarcticus ANT.BR TaxID=1111071 RepID=A0A1Q8YAA1_9BURK|nr:phage major capsid protein [Rhodoferax antarcticus]APW48414.1 capsid protein [Rhodoferax antarcticus]OLP04897.1 phage capsid family protein [Rhodoferax antarcticus ANT.BR]